MKRIAPLIIIVLVVLACGAVYASSHRPETNKLNGYVEGEFTRIAPTSGGVLQTLSVERGQPVKAGDALFALDLARLQADEEAAKAALAQANANWLDLTKGRRPEEIDVVEQQKAQAEAVALNAEKQWLMSKDVARKNPKAISKAQMDAEKADYDNAMAHVNEMTANLKTASMGAREDQISAARAAIDQAKQKMDQAEKILREAAPVAPAAGQIEDTFYRPGEFVAAGSPVVSLLLPQDVKVRFFVSEKMLPRLRAGQPVHINCDGCQGPIDAKVSFIASQSEYTPPVIYSVGSRDKLVFMIEAKPEKFDPQLRPGLPVDIDPVMP